MKNLEHIFFDLTDQFIELCVKSRVEDKAIILEMKESLLDLYTQVDISIGEDFFVPQYTVNSLHEAFGQIHKCEKVYLDRIQKQNYFF